MITTLDALIAELQRMRATLPPDTHVFAEANEDELPIVRVCEFKAKFKLDESSGWMVALVCGFTKDDAQ